MSLAIQKDKLLDVIIPLETAKQIIKESKKSDKYFVYDLQYCMFKPQEWCDHNIFGFYPSTKCVVYDLIQLKNELKS